MNGLPSGYITFLFTDIEGSTRLWETEAEAMRDAVARHDTLLRTAIESHGGYVFKTLGDAFCAAFTHPSAALAAAIDGQLALQLESDRGGPTSLQVRMALHAGVADERDQDYFGPTVNRVARLLSIAHGGQILLSAVAQSAVAHNLPSHVSLRDMGTHRLKDLLEAETVSQALHPELPESFPPLRSLQIYRHNLPCQVTSFIGREKEIAEVEKLLGSSTLVTLTGSGGTGKTRLSQQVAANVIESYADGVWLVELDALTDPTLVAQSVASILGVHEEPGRAVTDSLVSGLRNRNLLILLDNCEHVIDASAQLAAALIRSCPKVRILATSREPLQISGEFTYRVPSLDLPEPAKRGSSSNLEEYGAVRLFRDRAQAADARFAITEENSAAVIQICRRLDGIPLALELAAARVRSLPVQQIASRLDDRFALLTRGSRTALPRQQTLRALIDWSWDTLTDSERTMLARLSVFAGGWTLEASEEVCADPDAGRNPDAIDSADVLDLITELIDKSLVFREERGSESRYRLLDTVRHYGLERLIESGDDAAMAVKQRHFAWFLALAQEAEPHFDGPRMQEWLDRLETEHDNTRAALGFAGGEERLRLAVALYRFWFVRGYLTEGRDWIESGLRAAPNAESQVRATGLNRAGIMAWRQGDFSAARILLLATLDIRIEDGDRKGAAAALNNLGLVSDEEGDHVSARTYYEDAIHIYRDLSDRAHIGMVLANLGANLIDLRDLTAATAASEEFLEIAEETEDPWCLATAWQNLGEIAHLNGHLDSATNLFGRSLRTLADLGDNSQIVQLLTSFARIFLVRGKTETAVELLAAAEARIAAEGIFVRQQDSNDHHQALAAAQAILGAEHYNQCRERGAAMTADEVVKLALETETSGR